ncbi:MAG TPA: prephenate dehydratase [Bacteroidota bacterium]
MNATNNPLRQKEDTVNLKEIRENIDSIDQQLLILLRQRMEFALRAGKHKNAIHDPSREESVFRNVTSKESPLLEQKFIRYLYEKIISESKELQHRGLKLVGFQGEHGAWSEIAIHTLGNEMISIPCIEFGDVFAGVASGDFEFGLVPVENSIEGSVTEVNDLLVETSLNIVGEAIIPIHHNLLALPGTNHQELRSVYSHPQALGQCRSFLSRNKLEPRPFYDTAGAARWLAHEQQRSAGVIASRLAAELHGLEVIKENIEDHPQNATRFVLLSSQPRTGPANKCTIAFSTQHRVGALFDVLRLFAESKINLTRIESRPIRKNPGAFAFLLDFQGTADNGVVRQTLERVEQTTMMFKNLGFYPEASA